jgi:hypothetical protein
MFARRAAAKKMALGFQAQAMRALGRWQAGAKEELPMPHYKCDPRWITVRFEGKCVRYKRAIRTGERAFYYPEDRALHCEAEE